MTIEAGLSAKSLTTASVTEDELSSESFGHLTRRGFQRRNLSTPQGRMVVYEAGHGVPLVFLHGIGGGASSWGWSFVAPAFVDSYRVIVPDWVGWGGSEHPSRFLMFTDYVTQLEVLLDGLDAPAIIVAQSLAAGFAMALAERRPELVERFFFTTPTGGKDFGKDAFGPIARTILTPLAGLPGINLVFYRALFHRRAFIADWFRRFGFNDPKAVSDEVIESSLWSAKQPNAAYSALPFVTGKLRFDLAPYFERLAKPAAMLWGEEETQVGLQIGKRLAGLRPDVPLSLIANSKACPELEQPTAVIEVIGNAIAKSPKRHPKMPSDSSGG